MNLLHMKYALAVAETHSINKAAQQLIVGAPALSRAVKELENSLGVVLFERSAKGMTLTPDGELFVTCAKKVLKQVDDIENIFRDGPTGKQHFSISVPRSSYIASAFAEFSRKLDPASDTEVFYKETNSSRAIKNILREDYKLGILRYSDRYDSYYKAMMDEKHLSYELVTEFRYVLLMNAGCPLNGLPSISYADLDGYIEIAHADPYVPSLPVTEVKKDELPDNGGCRIFVFERASQLELLASNPDTYMWVSPIPRELLDRYGLVERSCEGNNRSYRDVLIRREDYRLTDRDNKFIEELVSAKRRVFRDSVR